MVDLDKELKEKQLKGLIKMRNWFYSISTHKDFDIKWTNEKAHLFLIETANILNYLDKTIERGKWLDSDREILNGMRDWYMVNRGVEYCQYLNVKI
jgi:hypothetical protein